MRFKKHSDIYFEYTFQSAHPHGMRCVKVRIITICRCFNQRTRTGCDIFDVDELAEMGMVSISAPARDAITVALEAFRAGWVSISAPARDAITEKL